MSALYVEDISDLKSLGTKNSWVGESLSGFPLKGTQGQVEVYISGQPIRARGLEG